MLDNFTNAESVEDTFFEVLTERLRSSRRACLGHHVTREQINPDEQLGVSLVRLRQRRDVIHRDTLK